jgi:hypothetical protein
MGIFEDLLIVLLMSLVGGAVIAILGDEPEDDLRDRVLKGGMFAFAVFIMATTGLGANR